jgi:hypothetical protein
VPIAFKYFYYTKRIEKPEKPFDLKQTFFSFKGNEVITLCIKDVKILINPLFSYNDQWVPRKRFSYP